MKAAEAEKWSGTAQAGVRVGLVFELPIAIHCET